MEATWNGQPSEPYLPPEGAITPKMVQDEAVLDAMERYGGSFVQSLAAAWRKADSVNSQRLHAAFSDYWNHYRNVAEGNAART